MTFFTEILPIFPAPKNLNISNQLSSIIHLLPSKAGAKFSSPVFIIKNVVNRKMKDLVFYKITFRKVTNFKKLNPPPIETIIKNEQKGSKIFSKNLTKIYSKKFYRLDL